MWSTTPWTLHFLSPNHILNNFSYVSSQAKQTASRSYKTKLKTIHCNPQILRQYEITSLETEHASLIFQAQDPFNILNLSS
jgi:hypothetical protein